jgi:hypothetical protein
MTSTLLNLTELAKSIYPNCCLENDKTYGFDTLLNKTVENPDKFIYMALYIQSNKFKLCIVETLDSASRFPHEIEYLFKIVGEISDFKNSKFDILNSLITNHNLILKNTFPIIPTMNLTKSSSKKDFESTEHYWYKNIASCTHIEKNLTIRGSSSYVRIISYGDNIDIDINSDVKTYNHENYKIWLYYIPSSDLTNDEICTLILDKFNKARINNIVLGH